MNESVPIQDGNTPSRPQKGPQLAPDAGPLLSPLRELQLVEAYREGDPDAIGTLLRSYQRRMYTVCYRMLRNDEEARDLTQESMIKVLEGLDSFDSRARLSTWVIRVTMNCCLSYLRKRKLRRHLSLDTPVGGATGSSGGSDSEEFVGNVGQQLADKREQGGEEYVELQETRRVVLSALESLDHHMRAVLVLRDMQGLEYQQIAEVIDKPVGTVKSRLFRARSALRDAIEEMTSTDDTPSEGLKPPA